MTYKAVRRALCGVAIGDVSLGEETTMAGYENLKDYLQNEHMKLINRAITNHQHDLQISDSNVKILSLYCTDDKFNNLEMELGVSVNITGDSEIECKKQLFYNVTLFGNLDLMFQDIRVTRIEMSDKNEFPKDNILNHFILPDIRKNDLERIGSELYSYYKYYAQYDGIDFPLDKIINNMNAPIFFTDLPDDCLGRVNFFHSDIEIFHYDILHNEFKYDSCHAEPGTILINKNRYYDKKDGEFLITVAHELVHWQLHQKFLKLLVILGTDSDTMNCKREPTLYDESMPDIHKAFCIAEWQANALAMRLAIPRCTVDTAINMVANDPAMHYDNYGDGIQACVINFARQYGVSCYVAKERLRQLGYDFVDGTILEYDDNGKKIQPAPFYFEPDTLTESETFVIYRADYEKLLREDKNFAELMYSQICVYTGYVVCLHDAKYIKPINSDKELHFVLSDYAREHVDECCMKFEYHNGLFEITNYNSYIKGYFCRLFSPDEYGTNEDGHFILSDKATKDMRYFFSEQYGVLEDMNDRSITSLFDALQYHKKRKKLTYEQIAERANLSKETIESYFAKPDISKYRKIDDNM